MEFSKFIVYYGVDDDPELLEQFCICVDSKFRFFIIEDLLTVLVNL